MASNEPDITTRLAEHFKTHPDRLEYELNAERLTTRGTNNVGEPHPRDKNELLIALDVLKDVTSLKTLRIGNINSDLSDEFFTKLATVLKEHPSIEVLVIEKSYLDKTAAMRLSELMKQSPNLQRVRLENNEIIDAESVANTLTDALKDPSVFARLEYDIKQASGKILRQNLRSINSNTDRRREGRQKMVNAIKRDLSDGKPEAYEEFLQAVRQPNDKVYSQPLAKQIFQQSNLETRLLIIAYAIKSGRTGLGKSLCSFAVDAYIKNYSLGKDGKTVGDKSYKTHLGYIGGHYFKLPTDMQSKKTAATALKNFLENPSHETRDELQNHKRALNHGDLGKLYKLSELAGAFEAPRAEQQAGQNPRPR